MLNDFIADMLSAESLNIAIKKEFPDTQQVVCLENVCISH